MREPDKVRRMVGPVAADERSLDWRLSARENLRFFGALHGLHGVALARRVEHLLVQMELCEAGERLVGTFSSGMKQRLLIARALLARPRVLLLDEPTRSLDPIAARAFRAFLRREIAERHGCTILLATHDPEEALELCDRVAVLDRGRLLALGTPPGLSLEFGRVRYRLWTRTPDHAALRRIPALGWAVVARREGEGDGWTMLEIDVAPGWEPDQLVTSLVMDGCNVGRFEQVQPSLADLIEQVAARRGASIDA